MTGFGQIENLIERAKLAPETAHELFSTLFSQVRQFTKDQRKLLVEKISEWAEKNQKSNPENFLYATFGKGLLAFHNEQYQEALTTLIQTHKLFADSGINEGRAMCDAVIGATYRTLGEVDLAIKYILDGLEDLKHSKNHPYFYGISIFNLAEIYSDIRNYDESLKLYQVVMEHGEQTGHQEVIALALNGMAVIYRHQKKYGLALENLNTALEISGKINHLPNKSRILSSLADYYLETGDYEQAIRFNLEALKIRQEIKLTGGSVTNMTQIAEIYRKQGKLDESISMLEKALVIAESINAKPKMFLIHRLLAEIYKDTGAPEKSLGHYMAFHEIRDEVIHEDAEKKVQNMKLIFEAEQTKKENAIIKAQKVEIEHKNIALQNTINELTLTKISKRAKAITIFVAVILLVAEDSIMHFVVNPIIHENFPIMLAGNGLIVILLKPIEKVIEHFLLNRLVDKKAVFARI